MCQYMLPSPSYPKNVPERPVKDSWSKSARKGEHTRPIPLHEARVTGSGELIQNAANVAGVRDRGVEMNPPGDVALDELPVAVGQEFPQQRGTTQLPGGEVVLFNKSAGAGGWDKST